MKLERVRKGLEYVLGIGILVNLIGCATAPRIQHINDYKGEDNKLITYKVPSSFYQTNKCIKIIVKDEGGERIYRRSASPASEVSITVKDNADVSFYKDGQPTENKGN